MQMKKSKNITCTTDMNFKCKHADTYLYKGISYYDSSDLKKFNVNIIAKVKFMTKNKKISDLNLSAKHSINDFILKEII